MENNPQGKDSTYEERGLQPFRSKHPLQRVIGSDRINFSSPQDLLLKKKQQKATKLLTGEGGHLSFKCLHNLQKLRYMW